MAKEQQLTDPCEREQESVRAAWHAVDASLSVPYHARDSERLQAAIEHLNASLARLAECWISTMPPKTSKELREQAKKQNV